MNTATSGGTSSRRSLSGVSGSGWVSRALAHGLDVVAWDPAPGAEAALRKRVANAWGALEKHGLAPGASQDRLRFVATRVPARSAVACARS